MLAVVNGHIDTAATLLEEDLVVSNADVVDKVWHGPSGACILHHTTQVAMGVIAIGLSGTLLHDDWFRVVCCTYMRTYPPCTLLGHDCNCVLCVQFEVWHEPIRTMLHEYFKTASSGRKYRASCYGWKESNAG